GSGLRASTTRSALPWIAVGALPGLALMMQTGWTDMHSAAWVGLAGVFWPRPIASGLALGAALGSKQFFGLALPLLVFYRDERWGWRTPVALVTAAVLVAPAFIWNAKDAWRAIVVFHAQTPMRPDSINIVGALASFGIVWKPPLWL